MRRQIDRNALMSRDPYFAAHRPVDEPDLPPRDGGDTVELVALPLAAAG